MEIGFDIRYHEAVTREDIPRLSRLWQGKVKSAIAVKLTTHPDIFGVPLRRSLRGYRKLRVGDYRVVFRIEARAVKVFAIEHRSVVFAKVLKRLGY